MIRTQVEQPQGSPGWHALRLTGYGASEASAMLGESPYVTRSELLMRKATGIAAEYDQWFTDNVLEHGHKVEALARPLAEAFIGEDLYPVVYRLDGAVDGAPLIASCDGLTIDNGTSWECKQWNAADADSVSAGILPAKHVAQSHQVMMVAGSTRHLFTISDGTPERTLHMWVHPSYAQADRIVAGWRQFHADRLAWTPPIAEPPKAVGKTMETLPALRVLVEGKVVDSNLIEWAEGARAVIRGINRNLKTDQDFADAEQAIKGCEKGKALLVAAKAHALAQTQTLDELFKTVDSVTEEMDRVRLDLEKLVTRRKTERKTELVSDTVALWHSFISETNATLDPFKLPAIETDFPGQLKNKRNIDSMKNALDTELARAKIEAANIANRIKINAKTLAARSEFKFLFNDAADLVLSDTDAVEAIAENRITKHENEQRRKAEELAEQEREKVRAEERAKLESEERERRAQAERDEQARIVQSEAAERQERIDSYSLSRDSNMDGMNPAPQQQQRAETAYSIGLPAAETPRQYRPMAPWPATTKAPASPTEKPEIATLNLGEIAKRWGSRMDSTFIRDILGIEARKVERGSTLYFESDWGRILYAIETRAAKLLNESGGIPF